MADTDYAKSIDLMTGQMFSNVKNARRFAIDIGGSLTKIAYSSKVQRRKTLISDEASKKDAAGPIYKVFDSDENCMRLHFVKFETKYIENCLDFIQQNLIDGEEFMRDKIIKATGGGSYKYKDLITRKLGVEVDKEDELRCLINGCNFLLKNIPDEAFYYQRQENPEYVFQGAVPDIFPYLLVNIGSGVSVIKVEAENKFERIGGTSTGGGTFWGLGSLLTPAKTFDELVELAERGDHRTVDLLVKDIYGGAYSEIGLPSDLIACSFGKAMRLHSDSTETFKPEDIARSLLLCISNDIGLIASLQAQVHGMKKMYFGGYFIRGHPMTMHTITYAINYWSKGEIQPLFLRHEGYLGAIGAFLKGSEEEDADKYSWGENYAGSSGLASPRCPAVVRQRNNTFDRLELDRLDRPLLPCSLLLDPQSYTPDTEDLTQDKNAREYWLTCFSDGVYKTKRQAIKSQAQLPNVQERADKFEAKYLKRLRDLRENPCAYGSLTVRSILDMSSQCLKECLFTDAYSEQKQLENEHALRALPQRLEMLDGLSWSDRQIELAVGLLTGNMFDWGAQAITDLIDNQDFGFTDAQQKLQARPWLIDDFDAWQSRLETGPPHKCAAVFCDNSGADIILGVFPFVRELLIRGTKVIICANTRPALNDVMYEELVILVKRVAGISDPIGRALAEERLLVMESGQGSPCLDLRFIDSDLVEAIKKHEADLLVIEGMGRAVHTNYQAAFACEALKVAVIKNKWLANRLGGDLFNAMFKYERSRKITVAL